MPISTSRAIHNSSALLWGGWAVYALVMLAISLMRHWGGMSSLIDLGVFDQVLWRLTHSGELTISMLPSGEMHWLGFHFSPLVLAIAPVYAVFPHAEIILATGIIVASTTVFPLYRACRALGASENHTLFWVVIWAVNPFTVNAIIWDFHEILFAMPLMAWGMYALIVRNLRLMLLSGVLLVLVKEHYGLALAGFGLAWGMRYREWSVASVIMIAGVGVFALVYFAIMPALRPDAAHYMLEVDARYQWLQDGVEGIHFMLTHPELNETRLFYFLFHTLPFLGVWLLQPWLLFPAIADVMANVASAKTMPMSLFSYHSGPVVPILTIAACAGSVALLKEGSRAFYARIPRMSAIVSISLGFLCFPAFTPISISPWQPANLWHSPPAAVTHIKENLTPEYNVSAQINIGAHFSQRPRITPFPGMNEQTDVVILYLSLPFENTAYWEYPFADSDINLYRESVEKLLRRTDWGIVYMEDGWVMLKRNAEDKMDRAVVRARVVAYVHAVERSQRNF